MKCYISNIILDDSNSSVEHIIPNALGGRLKSDKLLCREVNSFFGKTVDIALIKSIPIPSILEINRERGNNPSIQGQTLDGVKYNIKDRKTAIQAPRKPTKFIDVDGNEVIEFPASQEREILKSYSKKSNKSIEVLKKSIEYILDNTPKIIYFDNHFSVIGTPEAFRGIVKIATNYYVYKRKEKQFCEEAIDFVIGKNLPQGTVQYYYPGENIGQIESKEFSHIIHLKGDYTEKVLYCYIELFNVHNFIVVLNNNYDGPSFKETYVYDLDNQIEVKRNLDIRLTRKEISELECPGPNNLEDSYAERLERLSRLKGFKFERRNIKKKT